MWCPLLLHTLPVTSPDDDHTLVTLDSSDADNAEGQSTLPRVHISPGQTGRLLEAAWIPLESGKPLFTGGMGGCMDGMGGWKEGGREGGRAGRQGGILHVHSCSHSQDCG